MRSPHARVAVGDAVRACNCWVRLSARSLTGSRRTGLSPRYGGNDPYPPCCLGCEARTDSWSPWASLASELRDAHLATTIDGRFRPRQARIRVADVEPAHGQCPFGAREVPERRCAVIAQKVEEHALRLHFDSHESSVGRTLDLLIRTAFSFAARVNGATRAAVDQRITSPVGP